MKTPLKLIVLVSFVAINILAQTNDAITTTTQTTTISNTLNNPQITILANATIIPVISVISNTTEILNSTILSANTTLPINGLISNLTDIVNNSSIISGNFSEITDMNFTGADLTPIEVPSILPEIAILIPKEICFKKIKNLLSYMSLGEQSAFYNAYLSLRRNSTSSENRGRCFSPGFLKKIFSKIVKGSISNMSSSLTLKSKNIRNSFTCVKKAFDQIKSKLNFNAELVQVVNAQADSNRCLSNFLKDLHQILSSRRRYLLLNANDLNSTGIVKNDTVVSFPWINTEVEDITNSFLKFADCYQSFPDSMIKTFSAIQNLMAQDPVCALQEETVEVVSALRFLQNGKSDKSGNQTESVSKVDKNLNKTDSVAKVDKTVNQTESVTKTENKTESISKVDKTVNKTESVAKNGKSENKTESISKVDKTVNKTESVSKNGKTETIKKNEKQEKKGIGKVSFKQTEFAYVETIIKNYQNKTADYLNISESLGQILNNTLKAKCNFVGQLTSILNSNKSLMNFLKIELSKLKKNSACVKKDYVIWITSQPNNTVGKLKCIDTDFTCIDSEIILKKSNNLYNFALGCSAGIRFGFAYSSSETLGNYFDFVSNKFKTCKTGKASECAKKIKNLGFIKTLRFLQTEPTSTATASSLIGVTASTSTIAAVTTTTATSSATAGAIATIASNTTDLVRDILNNSTTIGILNSSILVNGTNTNATYNFVEEEEETCTAQMQKNCADILDNACRSSNLYQYIGQLAPSESDSPLPDACKNINAENPDYTQCFTWIKDNLIIYSLFPNFKAILNIQETIVKSQVNITLVDGNSTILPPLNDTSIIAPIPTIPVLPLINVTTIIPTVNVTASIVAPSSVAASLRNLQYKNDDLIILVEDASTKDPISQFPSDTYKILDNDIVIDGSTPEQVADVTIQANQVAEGVLANTGSNSNYQSFVRNSFALLVILILNLL